jgi:hypothetical protein
MTTAEARERAQLVLGAVSLVIWFGVAYALAVPLYMSTHTQRSILLAGAVALLVAALPWLGYRRLIRHFAERSEKNT